MSGETFVYDQCGRAFADLYSFYKGSFFQEKFSIVVMPFGFKLLLILGIAKFGDIVFKILEKIFCW